jgi:[FeFe] hydrogenase H-cluster maturation GTPase HydF
VKGRDAKPHIGIFGRRNTGKSSLINSLTEQDVAIVSDIAGTTTDPVRKSIEIFGIGPAIIVDTAGMDDFGDLGKKRVGKTKDTIKKIDLGILVLSDNQFGEPEIDLISEFDKWDLPYVLVQNKIDLLTSTTHALDYLPENLREKTVSYSTIDGRNRDDLIQLLIRHIPETAYMTKSMVGDIINPGDLVLLICPIDSEAPDGRLILPQVQAIRDVLDNDAIAVVAQEGEIETLLKTLQPKPAIAITDSQVFNKVGATIPEDIPLTSFSTVLAKYKGDFENYLKGTPHISKLVKGDKVLILESCTHQVSCEDIGRFKIPNWLDSFTGNKLDYTVVPGLNEVPGKITDYSIVIQCGGCMITRKQLINRLKPAIDSGIPVTNYGMAIAYVQGIYDRAIAPFTINQNNSLAHL